MGHPLVALSFVALRGWAKWGHAQRHVPLALTATPTRTGGFAFHRVKLIFIIFVFFVLLDSVFFLICFYMKYLPCYTSPIKGRWGIAPTGKLSVTDASEMLHTSSSGVGVGVQTLTSMSEAWNGCFIDANQNRCFCPGEVQFFTGNHFFWAATNYPITTDTGQFSQQLNC